MSTQLASSTDISAVSNTCNFYRLALDNFSPRKLKNICMKPLVESNGLLCSRPSLSAPRNEAMTEQSISVFNGGAIKKQARLLSHLPTQSPGHPANSPALFAKLQSAGSGHVPTAAKAPEGEEQSPAPTWLGMMQPLGTDHTDIFSLKRTQLLRGGDGTPCYKAEG